MEALLAVPERPALSRFVKAMRHGSLGGGKRLRPFLVVETASLFGVPLEHSIQTAAALECVHCYSLVHDDLPAMDDDDLRRGRPTVHKAFDEATAILAGDGLLTLAFEILSREGTHPSAEVRVRLVQALAVASGTDGMVGGQVLDIAAETSKTAMTETDIIAIQARKTGALIRFACEAGALLGGAGGERRRAVITYAEKLGLAFQVADDLLDAEGTAEQVGKATGKDAPAGKATFLSLYGKRKARKVL
ncbi:MAG: polyprenyl synthetase family protein, partial [Pseudomonadota bacterium]